MRNPPERRQIRKALRLAKAPESRARLDEEAKLEDWQRYIHRRSRKGYATKLTEQCVYTMQEALKVGLNWKTACDLVGIGETTLHKWLKKFPGLRKRLKLSQSDSKLALSIKMYDMAIKGDKDMLKTWLKARTEEFREKSVVIEADVNYEPDERFL